jgi:acyl-CoA synthetase (NDP forming)
MQSNLNCFFSAESVAVVGATTNPDKLGFLVLKNIIAGGFKGRIYAVNQKGGSVMNLQCYKT